MGTTANTGQSTWEQIHGGVRETERLIGQKNYNLAMVKARQTLEYMVKCLCERYGILETGLLEMIDALYSAGKISKTTCEHYHKIRTIGNKAIHEGHNSAYNANQAHHLLSQEVYTFANDYNDTKKSTRASRSAAPTPASSRLRGNSRHSSASSGNEKPAGTRSGSSEGRRPRAYAGGPSFEFRSIIKPVLLIIIIILLLLIIKMIRPATDAKPDSTAAVSTESLAPETEAETVAAESTVYRTTDTVNVRPEPSTDTDRIGVLAPDTDVEYLRDYDEKWAVISYNGQEAYVSRDFIRQVSQ
ncbi:SH3 domain-containing protein [Clostridium fessum]|uniref:SH3 domain-containing protein n=1 Tax=Clostridium fessum TaxID=2126740 RepID=UPI00399C082E